MLAVTVNLRRTFTGMETTTEDPSRSHLAVIASDKTALPSSFSCASSMVAVMAATILRFTSSMLRRVNKWLNISHKLILEPMVICLFLLLLNIIMLCL